MLFTSVTLPYPLGLSRIVLYSESDSYLHDTIFHRAKEWGVSEQSSLRSPAVFCVHVSYA